MTVLGFDRYLGVTITASHPCITVSLPQSRPLPHFYTMITGYMTVFHKTLSSKPVIKLSSLNRGTSFLFHGSNAPRRKATSWITRCPLGIFTHLEEEASLFQKLKFSTLWISEKYKTI